MELLTLLMMKGGPWGLLIGCLWLFRDYVRISLTFERTTKE